MARRKNASAVVEVAEENTKAIATPVYNMGEFEVIPFSERQYISVFYGIREMYGQVCRKSSNSTEFDWEAFNAVFEGCFGKVEQKEHSLDDLGEFAKEYFNKSISEVVEYNRNSLIRRKQKSTSANFEMPKLKAEPAKEEIPY